MRLGFRVARAGREGESAITEPSSEFRFVCAAARWALTDPGADSAVRAAATAVRDWNRVAAIAARQRVRGLVAAALARNADVAPQSVVAQAHACASRLTMANLHDAAEMIRIDRAFRAAGAAPRFFKGMTLSQQVYGTLASKESRDIDLLVARDGIDPAYDALIGLGYRPVLPRPDIDRAQHSRWLLHNKETAWRHPAHGTLVEVHSELIDYPAMAPALRGARVMLQKEQRVSLGVGSVATLPTRLLYSYLCIHGAWSGWTRLKWLADLVAHVRRQGIDTLDELHADAVASGAGRPSLQALRLAHDLLALPLTPALAGATARSRVHRVAAVAMAQISGAHEATEHAVGGEAKLAVIRTHFALQPSPKLLPGLVAQKLANPSDRMQRLLPAPLDFLYPVLPVLRLLARTVGLLPRYSIRRGFFR